MNEVKGTIEDWYTAYDNKNMDTHFHIVGTMHGKPIHTSRVITIREGLVHTRNSVYRLGFPAKHIYEVIQ